MSFDYENGLYWRPVKTSAVAVALTGVTDETVLATIPVGGGIIGKNGMVRVTLLASVTNHADDKIIRVRLGGLAGTALMTLTNTTVASVRAQCQFQNRNSHASQVGYVATLAGAFGTDTGALLTATVNLAAAQDLVITGQLETAGHTITLAAYLVEILHAP